jgi:hypothetical protein
VLVFGMYVLSIKTSCLQSTDIVVKVRIALRV